MSVDIGFAPGTKVLFVGSPVWLKGSKGVVVYQSQMQPEVVTVIFSDGRRLVTDVFQLQEVSDDR